jgi:hypothetical protein
MDATTSITGLDKHGIRHQSIHSTAADSGLPLASLCAATAQLGDSQDCVAFPE